MRCSTCEHDNPDDAALCGGCGSALSAVAVAVAPAAAPAHGRLPSTLAGGRYVVGQLLGEGAMKRVYAGRDERLDREVAIASMKPEELEEAGRPRLRREARAMARLDDHPNVVRVYDVFEEGHGVYIVTQLMAGGELARRLRSAPHGRLAVDDAIAVAIQICRALEHAHRHGVVHRDVKPSNIWLTEDGTAKLGDFGLAIAGDRSRLTAEGLVLGTVAYMAPEQFVGRTLDVRSDLYALGATLYEMVTGRPPFVGDDVVAVISQHVHTPPVAPSCHNAEVTAELDQIVLDLLSKDPEARPASAAIVCRRLAALASLSASAAPAPVGANPLDRLASGIFVGRTAEVERLRSGLEEALSGRPRVLLIAGEPGIGKTRTAEELTTYAGLRGALAVWGRSWERHGAPPFWPWIQIVRAYLQHHEPREILADLGGGAGDVAHLVPEIGDVLPGLPSPPRLEQEQARFRLFDALVTLLRNASRRRPIVVVLDDLHWADEASLLLLQFLVREIGQARLLVVGMYRDFELRRGHPLLEALADLARHQGSYRVPLRGLSQEEVARFIGLTTGGEPPESLVRAVYDATEGNPFFVHEVVRLLASEGRLTESPGWRASSLEIPHGVRDVVGRRLDRLSEACNEALAVASVLGREFDLGVLARVSGTHEAVLLESLHDAMAARILVEGPELRGHYRFAHALVRETVYDELSVPRRVHLHRRAGEVLEQIHGDSGGARLADIAHHFWQSARVGDPERALAACLRAAEWARSRQAWEDAALHLERALQVLEEGGDRRDRDRQCELVVSLAEMQALGADLEKTHQTALRGVELARQIPSPRQLTRAVLAYGGPSNFIEAGRVDATMAALLHEALAALGPDDSHLRARVLQRLAQELTFSADQTRIAALLEQAMAIAEEIGDPALEAAAALSLQFGFRIGRDDEALDESRRLAALARKGGNPTLEQRAWSQAVTGAIWLGRVEEAQQAIEEERRLGEELRTPFARYLPLRHDAMLAILAGRFVDASVILLRCEKVAASSLGGTNMKQWNGAARYLMRRHLGSSRGPGPSRRLAGRFGYPLHRAFLSALHLSAGERDEASRELDLLAANDFALLPRDTSWFATLTVAADLTCELGAMRHAAPLYDLLRPYRGRWPTVGLAIGCLGPVDLGIGRLAFVLGRHQKAEGHLRDAITLAAGIGARPFLAEAHAALGAVLLARDEPGERAAATEQLRLAWQLASELGMQKVIAAVRATGLVPEADSASRVMGAADGAHRPTITRTAS